MLCNHNLYRAPEHLITPKGNLIPTKQPLPNPASSPAPGDWQLVMSVSMNLLILDISYKWNHTLYDIFCIGQLLSLSIVFWRFIYAVAYVSVSFLFMAE